MRPMTLDTVGNGERDISNRVLSELKLPRFPIQQMSQIRTNRLNEDMK
jgi:hypothetical protein